MIVTAMMVLLVNSQPGFLRRPSEMKSLRSSNKKRKKKRKKYQQLDVSSPGEEDFELVKAEQQLDYLEEEYQNHLAEGDLDRLCVTCQILKPDRAKHCVEFNMCVDKFDHWCPYIINAVGRQNHVRFFIMIIAELIALLWFICVAIIFLVYRKDAPHTRAAFYPNLICAFLALFFLLVMLITQSFAISVNETTNERANWKRYDYLVNPETKRFFNPYNYGSRENWKRFFFENNADPPKKETFITVRKTSMNNVRMNPFIKQMIEQQYDFPLGTKFLGLERTKAWSSLGNLSNTDTHTLGGGCGSCDNHI